MASPVGLMVRPDDSRDLAAMLKQWRRNRFRYEASAAPVPISDPPRYTKVVCLGENLRVGGSAVAQVLGWRPESHVTDLVASSILDGGTAGTPEVEVTAYLAGSFNQTASIPVTASAEEFHRLLNLPSWVRVTLGTIEDQRLANGLGVSALLRWRIEQPAGGAVITFDFNPFNFSNGTAFAQERTQWVGTDERIVVSDPLPGVATSLASLRRSSYLPTWDTDRWLLTSDSTDPVEDGDFISCIWNNSWQNTAWQASYNETLAVATLGGAGFYELYEQAGADLLEDPPQTVPIHVCLVWFNDQWNPITALPDSFLAWQAYYGLYAGGWSYGRTAVDGDVAYAAQEFIAGLRGMRGAIALAEWTGQTWVLTRAERRPPVVSVADLDLGAGY